MGKSYTPKYRVENQTRSGWQTFSAWNSKGAGKPTIENLIKFREMYHASLKAGGCNDHIGISGMIGNVRIIHQATGAEIVSFKAPLFEAI